MIFHHTADWVLGVSPNTGKPKTLTSRPLRIGDYINQATPSGDILMVKDPLMRTKYVVGQTYAIQPGRGKPSLGRFVLRRVYRALEAGSLSQDEAEAEGFADPDAFREVWRKLYGEAALNQMCWRLQLEVVK